MSLASHPSTSRQTIHPLHALLLLQVGLAEHRAHEIALLDADAMLAGQHAADLDAELQDVGAEVLRLLQLARLVGVVEDERMQVAVAGVKDVGDAQAVARAELAHALQDRKSTRLNSSH